MGRDDYSGEEQLRLYCTFCAKWLAALMRKVDGNGVQREAIIASKSASSRAMFKRL